MKIKKNHPLFIVILLSTVLVVFMYSFNHRKLSEKSHESLKYLMKNKETDERSDKSGNITDMLKWQFETLRNPKTNQIPVNIRKKELAFANSLPTSRTVQLRKATNMFSNSGWIPRGPNNQGGRTKALAADVANENIILAGAAEGGIWRSTDKGNTWKETTDPATIQNIDCMTQDTRPGKTNTWYYGTGELIAGIDIGNKYSANFLGNGIYKSTDNGITWHPLESTIANSPEAPKNPFQIVWKIVVDTTIKNQDVLYAACWMGVLKSTDEGNTWNYVIKNINSNGHFGYFSSVALSSSGGVFAAINYTDSAGVYYSADGTNFKNITPKDWPSIMYRMVLCTVPKNKNILYMLANTPGVGNPGDPSRGQYDYNSLWRYNLSTNEWTNLSNKLPAWQGITGGYSSQDSYDMILKVKPDDENIVLIGGTNLYRTTDAFTTKLDATDLIGGYYKAYEYSDYPGHHSDQQTFFFFPSNPNECLSGNDGGISVTNDITANQVNWKKLNEGYVTGQFWSVSIDKATKGSPIILGGMQDNGNYIDMTSGAYNNWVKISVGDGVKSVLSNGSRKEFISIENGSIYEIDAATQKFTLLTPKDASGFLFVTPYILAPYNNNKMYLAAGAHLWYNSNLSAIPLNNDTTEKKTINWSVFSDSVKGDISALSMSAADSTLLYIGTSEGKLYKIDSAENIKTKFNDITGANFPNGYVYSIDVDPNDAKKVLIAFSNYSVISIYYTTDGGNTWQPVSGNLEENQDGSGSGPSVRCVKILPVGGTDIYLAGTSTGLYMTTSLDSMSTKWIQQSPDGIGNVIVQTIDVRSSDGAVVAGTFGKGVYSTFINVTGIKNNNKTPEIYSLSQNYPNPFNPSTTIQYNLQKPGLVSLKIYDSIGRLVKTIVNGYQSEGEHKVVFNTNALSVASGIYFYRLKTNNFSSTKKMILLK